MPLHNHADRDAIKARAEADFLNPFEEHGGRRRGEALHCLFHEDRSPSASTQAAPCGCLRLRLEHWIERETAPAEVK